MQEKIVKQYVCISLVLCLLTALLCYGIYLVLPMLGWDMAMTHMKYIMAFVCILVLWGYSIWYVGNICHKIDKASDVFAEILEDSVKPDRAKTSIEVWNEKLSSSKQEGAVGRLEHHILESVRILGQREISSRKEQQYLKKMMTDISHQIKTPLASLQVFLDIFEQKFTQQSDDTAVIDMVHQAQKQSIRIHRLVIGLLKLTRLESGMLTLQKQPVNLNILLQECVQSVCANYIDKDLNVVLSGDPEVSICCDREWTLEALDNLLKNAGEYSESHGKIEVTWSASEMAVIVKITDHGAGIAAEELPKIFNRFYRVHPSDASTEGVGIGLALAKEIIEKQGGSLVVESSTNKPSYTSFEIVFLLH
ncbi:MAG: sensor histidine kinase [Clostridium sp.]|jgi:signal transduction histidine kinase